MQKTIHATSFNLITDQFKICDSISIHRKKTIGMNCGVKQYHLAMYRWQENQQDQKSYKPACNIEQHNIARFKATKTTTQLQFITPGTNPWYDTRQKTEDAKHKIQNAKCKMQKKENIRSVMP